jgi:hypothetical protein
MKATSYLVDSMTYPWKHRGSDGGKADHLRTPATFRLRT